MGAIRHIWEADWRWSRGGRNEERSKERKKGGKDRRREIGEGREGGKEEEGRDEWEVPIQVKRKRPCVCLVLSLKAAMPAILISF